MKTFIGVNSTRSRYKLTLAGVLLLIATSAWAVTPVEEVKLLADDGAPNAFFGFNVAPSGAPAVVCATTPAADLRALALGAAVVLTPPAPNCHPRAQRLPQRPISENGRPLTADGTSTD